MSRRNQSIIDCECCKHRFAQRQYSDRGSLCEKCENHFDDRGRLQEQYPREAGLNFVSNRSISRHDRQCFCCELYFSEAVEVEFRCRIEDHNVYVCLNCGEKQLAIMVCKSDGQKPTRASANDFEEKQERQRY